MRLTKTTFMSIVKTLRAVYGSNWRSDLDNDPDAQMIFFTTCQAVLPEEMTQELVSTYCTTRAKAPESPFDIVQAYLDKQLEEALSADDAIDRIVEAIRSYEYGESVFTNCDEFLLSNVINFFPCPEGVGHFYRKNRSKLRYLALYSPVAEEKEAIYKNLGFNYRKQVYSTAKLEIIERTQRNTLPDNTVRGNLHD